ncbi:putative squalene monooxygenase [Rosa chinensis]|uniref:Squalene monooxygenase n=1 Tax=Rosa chinensis TaxID=74649 RepID=A0A2P6PJN1_ROSCH|nr:putative squalene monooxygenase [Rosa chinensis]
MIISSTLGGKKQFKASGGVKSNGFGNGEFLPEMEEEKSTDVVIVGAGVAGAALAYTLAKEGRRVHVIERDLSEPDRIVGELLQPGGYLKLIELGLEVLSYPLEKYSSDVAGRSFHNGRFIQRMREKDTTLSNVKMEQGSVTTLIEEKGIIKGVIYKNKTGEEMRTYAPLTIVCDGYFSNLCKSLSAPKVESPSCFVGLILEDCELHGHVILGDPSPILFYPISSTEVRYLVDVPGTKVPSQLYNAFMVAVEKGNIRSIQNKSMAANPVPTPGAILLGDSFNMRHPLTGRGMTVALSDIVLLRDLLKGLRNLNDAPALSNYLESFYTLCKVKPHSYNS